MAETKNPIDSLTIEQVEEARRLGPQMLEILAGWQCAEMILQATGASFRDRLRAAEDLRGLFAAGEAIVSQILNADKIDKKEMTDRDVLVESLQHILANDDGQVGSQLVMASIARTALRKVGAPETPKIKD